MKKIFGLAVCLALMTGMPVFADWDKARDAYENGDYAAALREFKLLAEQGSSIAQFNLGRMYRNGEGVTKNYHEAFKWFTLSAENGDASAQDSLGIMYYWGESVPQDYQKSFKWTALSAEQGYASAQNNLGAMYYFGKGVPQNYILAHMWFNLSVSNDYEDGVNGRELVAETMTPEQIVEAQKLAKECVAKKYKGC